MPSWAGSLALSWLCLAGLVGIRAKPRPTLHLLIRNPNTEIGLTNCSGWRISDLYIDIHT